MGWMSEYKPHAWTQHSAKINVDKKGFQIADSTFGGKNVIFAVYVMYVTNCGLRPVPLLRRGSSWCLTENLRKTRGFSRGDLRITAVTLCCRARVHLAVSSVKCGVGGWTETQHRLLGTPVVSAHFLFVFSFRLPLFWLQISPFSCLHLRLGKSEMSVSVIQTHSYGLKQSVLFNSHTVAVNSFFFVGFFF